MDIITRACFVCNKTVLSAFDDYEMDILEPASKAVCFTSGGNFGSTIFDPMDGTIIEITVCDDCLKNKKDRVIAYKIQHKKSYKKVDNPI